VFDGVPGVSNLQLIDHGPTQDLWHGTDDATGRPVTVTVSSAVVVNNVVRTAFLTEAQTARSLEHPNVVRLLDAGITAEGHPYVISEIVEGTLGDRLARQGRLRWPEVVALGAEVADALAVAHRRGLLHRNVAPSTIALGPDDVPRLCGFALARVQEIHAEASTTSTTGPTHTAPEVLAGQAPDERSDIYSLASTLYLALSGAPALAPPAPGASEPAGTDGAPASLRSWGIPDAVAAVVTSAMAGDPTQRPASAELFAQELLAAGRAQASPSPVTAPRATSDVAGAVAPARADVTAATQAMAPGAHGVATAKASSAQRRHEQARQRRQPSAPTRRRRGLAAGVAVAAAAVVAVVVVATSGTHRASSSRPTLARSTTVESATTSPAATTEPTTTLAPVSSVSSTPATTEPTPTSDATTAVTLSGTGFHVSGYSTDLTDQTFRVPADGQFHSFTYDVQVAGGTSGTACPFHTGLTNVSGPGLANLSLGSCFPVSGPPNQVRVRAFAVTTVRFTIYFCDGPAGKGSCGSAARSTNGIDITIESSKP